MLHVSQVEPAASLLRTELHVVFLMFRKGFNVVESELLRFNEAKGEENFGS